MKKYFLDRCLKLVPEELTGISRKKFLQLAEVMFSDRVELTKKTLAVTVFLRWRNAFFKDYQLIEFTKTVDWLFDAENNTEFNLVKYIKIGGKKYYGPVTFLHKVSWGTFRNTADYFELFELKQEEQFLNKGIALLFPAEDFEKHAIRIGKLKMSVRLAIYWNWILMITYLAEIYPYLFSKSTHKTEEKKLHLWYNFMNDWLDFKVEDFAKKDRMPALEILQGLNLQMKASRERKKK